MEVLLAVDSTQVIDKLSHVFFFHLTRLNSVTEST